VSGGGSSRGGSPPVRLSSLAVRLFLSVLLVGAGLTMILGLVNVAQDYRTRRVELQMTLDAIDQSYAPAVAQSLFEFDLDQIDLLLEGIVLLRNVEYARVVESRPTASEVIASYGSPLRERQVEPHYPLRVRFEDQERELGRLEIHASEAAMRRAVRDRLGLLVLSSGVQIFAVALVIWLILEYSVVRHLRHIASHVRSVHPSTTVVPALTLRRRGRPDELSDIVTAINDANARVTEGHRELSLALEQKNTLLQELYHRTKNNMQLIVAMLDMRAARSSDSEEVRSLALDVRTRVHAMAMAHEKLYQSRDLSRILVGDYLNDLVAAVSRSLADGRLSFNVVADETSIMLDTAVPLGLVVSELVSNTVKHAYGPDERGEVLIRFGAEPGGTLHMSYRDDGAGPPAGFDPRRDAGVGLRTVIALVESQLDGTVEFGVDNGFACYLTFVDDRYAERI